MEIVDGIVIGRIHIFAGKKLDLKSKAAYLGH